MTAPDPDLRPSFWIDVMAAFGLFAATLVLLLLVSRATGPAFDELGRLDDVHALQQTVLTIASEGPAALGRAETQAALSRLGPETSRLLALAGAWSVLSVGRVGLLDPLTSTRLPWLIAVAAAPALLFAWVRRGRSRTCALSAGALLAVLPTFVHGAAVARTSLLSMTSWLAILAACAAARRARAQHRRRRMALVALAVVVSAAMQCGASWALGLATLHAWLADWRGTLRSLRAGRLTLPSDVIVGLIAAPIGWFLLSPERWGATTVEIVRAALAPLGPSLSPAEFAGRIVREPPVPAAFGGVWLACATPLAVTLAAGAGVLVIAHRALARRFASGRLRPPRDHAALGVWVTAGLGVALLGPALSPAPLVVFPPRIEIALPFVAIAAALGAVHASRRWFGRGGVVPAVVIVVVTAFSLRSPATLGAAYDGLLGPRAIQSSALLPLGDGSELTRLASAATALDVENAQVPAGYWEALRCVGIAATIEPDSAAPCALVRGGDPRPALARVERSGAVLWSIVCAR